MKKIFLYLIVLSVFFGLAFTFREPLLSKTDELIYYSPCSQPIAYRIGKIDPQFKISKKQFSSDILKASGIWNQIEGKNLFTYDPDAKLTINMVFDKRQYLVSQIDALGSQLEDEEKTLTPKIQEYENRVLDFNRQISELNSQIAYWNSQGGAPPEIYSQLVSRQEILKGQAEELRQMAKTLNLSAQNYNQEINRLNNQISNFNKSIVERPEEGIYDPNENKIDIYFNISQNELIHTLAHEMGHALMLEHNSNSKSIMYPFTTDTLKASIEDKNALSDYCREQNRIAVLKDEIIERLKNLEVLIYRYFKSS